MPDPQSISVNEEERMIPVWSIILASLAFVLSRILFLGRRARAAPPSRRRPSACASTSTSPGESSPPSTSSWSATSAKMRRAAP